MSAHNNSGPFRNRQLCSCWLLMPVAKPDTANPVNPGYQLNTATRTAATVTPASRSPMPGALDQGYVAGTALNHSGHDGRE